MSYPDSCHVVVCDFEKQRFLTTDGESLPDIKWDEDYYGSIDVLCTNVRDSTDAGVNLVYLGVACEIEYDELFYPTLLTFHAVGDNSSCFAGKQQWLPLAQVNQVQVKHIPDLLIPILTEIAETGIEYFEKNPVPYARPGFYGEISEWIREHLDKISHTATSIVQKRGALESYLVVVETESNAFFFFKALPPHCFNNEVGVSCALAEVMPETFWKPVGADAEKRWMLMKDFGRSFFFEDCELSTNADLAKQILIAWAGVQKASIPVVDKLLERGLPLYDLDGYKRKFAGALKDPEYLQALWDDMSEEEQVRYGKDGYKREALAFMERICDKLGEYKVPLTLVHGDLNPTNICRRGEDDFSYFDHAYTCISHPFFDALTYINFCRGDLKDLDFYLELWTEYGSMESLRELLRAIDDLDYVENQLFSIYKFHRARKCNRAESVKVLASARCSIFSTYL